MSSPSSRARRRRGGTDSPRGRRSRHRRRGPRCRRRSRPGRRLMRRRAGAVRRGRRRTPGSAGRRRTPGSAGRRRTPGRRAPRTPGWRAAAVRRRRRCGLAAAGGRVARWAVRRAEVGLTAGEAVLPRAVAGSGADRVRRIVGGQLGRDRQADAEPPGLVLQRPQAAADQPGGLDPLHPQLAVEPVDHLAAHPADLVPQRGHVLGQPALQLAAQVDLQLQLVLAAGRDLLLQLDLVRPAQLQRGAGIAGRRVRLPPARGAANAASTNAQSAPTTASRSVSGSSLSTTAAVEASAIAHRGDQRERAQATPAA